MDMRKGEYAVRVPVGFDTLLKCGEYAGICDVFMIHRCMLYPPGGYPSTGDYRVTICGNYGKKMRACGLQVRGVALWLDVVCDADWKTRTVDVDDGDVCGVWYAYRVVFSLDGMDHFYVHVKTMRVSGSGRVMCEMDVFKSE